MNKKDYDSSYDSDPEQKPHQPISQKTSETLAQEFAEHITLSPIFQSRIDFAQKLGYTQSQLTQALEKLGPDPGQDELLSELIKLDGFKKDEEIEENKVFERLELRHVVIDGCNVARE
jgi:ribonuclease ZC3H12